MANEEIEAMQFSIFIFIFLLSQNLAFAQNEAIENVANVTAVEARLGQKIKMVNHILNSPDLLERVDSSNDSLAKELLARAAVNFLVGEGYFGRGQYLEAEAVVDYVLRDLSACSQLINVSQLKKKNYKNFIAQLDSFILPEWEELSESEDDFLSNQLEQVSDLRNQAIRHADAGDYDEALALLGQAYGMKSDLLDKLQHETTIVYDLDFDSNQDEFQYLINRTYHYLELVQYSLSKYETDKQSQKLIDNYIYRSMVNLEIAEGLQNEGIFLEAIPVLKQSIALLSAVLRILGVKI
jgi:hypothetical protein